ncbi:tetratricopeptide repeat protein [Bacillus solitudinis]|uniref:tetratricopeptide repeat protein n=1 Tax=Bacillus solitudinis TaxID=2014074 RepID=UPI000C2512CF|nr:GTP-binding protein [Bacillus solitudinis]
MINERDLIQKSVHTQFVSEEEELSSIHVLANQLNSNSNNDKTELAFFRFAQGEIYYHFYDYETAIFKWEKVDSDLEPWAKKNMGDAYYNLRQLEKAEKLYLSIQSKQSSLNSEVAIKLFTLYSEQSQLDAAAKIIKRAVLENPDYPMVTSVARSFFEEYRDWDSAIELAVNESIRTEDLLWFNVLKGYVEEGYTVTIDPSHFSKTLQVLNRVDQVTFEELVVALWTTYKDSQNYFSWINHFNDLFLTFEIDYSASWSDLSNLYKDTYAYLINGTYLIHEIANIVPTLLSNWFKISNAPLATVTAILSWNEILPTHAVNQDIVEAAKNKASETPILHTNFDEVINLFEVIIAWAESRGISISCKQKWMVDKINDLKMNHILIAGHFDEGKSQVLKSLIGDSVDSEMMATTLYQNADNTYIREIRDTDIREDISILEIEEFKAVPQDHLFEVSRPCNFLNVHNMCLINTSNKLGVDQEEGMSFTLLADSLIFVLNTHNPFNGDERDLLLKFKEQAPNTPVHFLFDKMDAVYTELEEDKLIENIKERIHAYCPRASVLVYSSSFDSELSRKLESFIQARCVNRDKREVRHERLLVVLRQLITQLLKKRVDVEIEQKESISWLEETVDKLNGAVHQLRDMEKEKVEKIKAVYQTIKDDMKKDLLLTIPKLLHDCSKLMKEDSDFRTIHIELNKEMNHRIQQHIQHTVLTKFSKSIQTWLTLVQEEFAESQTYLDEIRDGFNLIYGHERFNLDCDFRIFEDWARDMERMANGVHIDEMNILLRYSPTQLLLKTSGKLFSSLPMNQSMIYKLYKKGLEHEDYQQVAENVTEQFMVPFDLFERGLTRDIIMFFKHPFRILNEAIEEGHTMIEETNQTLVQLQTNPELYLDPLTLFNLRLRQFELMCKKVDQESLNGTYY